MKVRFLRVAREELQSAFRYYREQNLGVGLQFLDEMRAALVRVQQMPNGWHPVSEHTRRCLLRRFPYGIIYQIKEGEIVIVAVAHLHREPGYWEGRS